MKDGREFILNADQLRKSLPTTAGPRRGGLQKLRKTVDRRRNAIYIVLDNVLDTYNIGSIFRLADAVAAKKIYLCGGTETPPNPRIKKASINTTEWVEWEYAETAAEAIKKVRNLWNCHPEESSTKDLSRMRVSNNGFDKLTTGLRDSSLIAQNDRKGMVVAIEQSTKSVPYDQFEYKLPVCLVVGHESEGVSKEVLEMVDGIVELPMFGVNKSLNVMVSLGIVLYEILEKISS